MTILTAGYPTSNPLLLCILSIEDGEDVETALLRRDVLLETAFNFFTAAWGALGWFEPDASDFAVDLMTQAEMAWGRLSSDQQLGLWADMVSAPPRTRFQSELVARLDPVSP